MHIYNPSEEKFVVQTTRMEELVEKIDSLRYNLMYPNDLPPFLTHIPNPVHETNELLSEQNALLQTQISELKMQNETLKIRAERSAKDAKQSKVFGWSGIVIGIVGIIVAIWG